MAPADRVVRAQRLAGETGPTPCNESPQARAAFARYEARLEALMNRQLTVPSSSKPATPMIVPATTRNIGIAAAPALAMCARCPLTAIQQCGTLGVISRHTGIAGAAVMQRGRLRRLAGKGTAA